MKNWINFGVIHAMTSITPGGQTLVAHFISRLLRFGSEKVTPKNIFSLKWWGFEMVDFHLPWNHGISANKSPFEKKQQQQQKHIQVMSWMTFLPKNFSGIFHPQNERKLMLERSHFPRSTISGGLFIPENFQPITLRIAK